MKVFVPPPYVPAWQRIEQNHEQQIVVMEGPDGCGKTNIGQAIAMKLQIPYFKMTTEADNWRKGKFKEALQFDQTYLVQLARQVGFSAVIDRAWPSEWVYSRVFERETDHQVLEKVDQEMGRLGTLLVIPLRHDYGKARKDELVPSDRLGDIHDAYLRFIEWTSCNVIGIYVDDLDLKAELAVFDTEYPRAGDRDYTSKVIVDNRRRLVGGRKGKLS